MEIEFEITSEDLKHLLKNVNVKDIEGEQKIIINYETR